MKEETLWVHQTLAGDREAFDHLVRKYWGPIYARIASTVRNHADAEDLTNGVFAEAYQCLPRLRESSSFYPWLRQIARHHCQDWLRQRREPMLCLDEVSNEAVAWNPVEDELLYQERLNKTLEAIEALPEIDKALMRDFYLEDAPYTTLQRRYYLSKAAVKMRLFKARGKVREQVRKLLSGIAAFQMAKKLLVRGGLEIVKTGVRTKIAVVGAAAVISIGGTGVLLWNHHQTPQAAPSPEAAVQKPAETLTVTPILSKKASEPVVDTRNDTPQEKQDDEELTKEQAEEFLSWLDSLEDEPKTAKTEAKAQEESKIDRELEGRLRFESARRQAEEEIKQLPFLVQQWKGLTARRYALPMKDGRMLTAAERAEEFDYLQDELSAIIRQITAISGNYDRTHLEEGALFYPDGWIGRLMHEVGISFGPRR